MATITSTPFTPAVPQDRSSFRNLAEITLGFTLIVLVLWLPTREQLIVGPIVLLAPLALVLATRPTLAQLGLGLRGFLSALWILPAAAALIILSIFVARELGTFHALYQADFRHVGGYVLWTIYQ